VQVELQANSQPAKDLMGTEWLQTFEGNTMGCTFMNLVGVVCFVCSSVFCVFTCVLCVEMCFVCSRVFCVFTCVLCVEVCFVFTCVLCVHMCFVC